MVSRFMMHGAAFVVVIAHWAGLASADLTPSDDATLTSNLETLAVNDANSAAVNSANTIFQKATYTANDWNVFFEKYFNTQGHTFTDPLWRYLYTYPLFSPNFAQTIRRNIQDGMTSPLWNKSNAIISAHSANLGPDLSADANLRQSLLNCHKIFAQIGDQGDLLDASRTAIFNNYKVLIGAYPQYFHSSTTVNTTAQPYVGALRAQVWMAFRDILTTLTPSSKTDVINTLGLTGKYLDLWNTHSVLIHDNNGFTAVQKDKIYELLGLIPAGLQNTGSIVQEDLIGNVGSTAVSLYLPQFTTSTKGWIKIFKDDVGAVSQNQFPNDISPIVTDFFTIALAHELNHIVDFHFIEPDPARKARKSALQSQAGTTILQYLRSNAMTDQSGNSDPFYFQNRPQEFFASISNDWFADSKHTLDLGILRFDAGYHEPLNQALFFMDIYSLGGSASRFYGIDTTAVITVQDIPITRDGSGRVTGFTYGQTSYAFTLDVAGNVTAYSTVVNNTAPNIPGQPSGNANLPAGTTAAYSTTTTDPENNQVQYTFDWGDGTTYTTALVNSGSTGSASKSWAAAGTYSVRVMASDSFGAVSGWSAALTVVVTNPPPAAPANLAATAASSSQINLSWTDNANNEDGFKIERSTDNVTFTEIATVSANATTFSNTGLTASTPYTYRVRAYNATGNSGYSNTASATTPSAVDPSLMGFWSFNGKDGRELAPGDLEGVADANLKGLWHLNEIGGTSAYDSSWNNHTGTYGASTKAPAQTAASKFGRGLSFDGVNDYVSVVNTPSLNNLGSQMTIEAWVNPSVVDGALRQIVDLRNAAGSSSSYLFQFGNLAVFSPGKTSTMRATGGAGASGSNTYEGDRFAVYTQYPFSANTWYHVAVVYNGALPTAALRARIYVNGADVTYEPFSTGIGGNLYVTTDNTLKIGSHGLAGSQFFKGTMDEVGIYNTALTASQVGSHYSRGFALDATANNNKGTISGAVQTSGKVSTALSFDGVDDRVEVADANNTLDMTGSLTLGAWVYWLGDNNGIVDGIIAKGSANYRLMLNTNGTLRFVYLDTAGGWHAYNSTSVVAINGWHHVAVTYTSGQGSGLRMYIDGNLVTGSWGTGTGNGTLKVNNSPFVIGMFRTDADTGYDRPFRGAIDEVRVYNRILSATEVQAQYTNPGAP